MGYSHLCDDYEPEELVCITSHDDKDYYSMDDFYDLDDEYSKYDEEIDYDSMLDSLLDD